MAPRNLLNLENAVKSYGRGPLLDSVSLGVAVGERIGVVGRNGGGKSTLLNVMAGRIAPDSGRVTRGGDVALGVLAQAAQVDPATTIRDYVVGDREVHEWTSDAATRDVMTALLGGISDSLLDRQFGQLSGGEKRRTELAQLLISDLDLLMLDEPTNHLDVEAIAWLAQFLKSKRNLAVVVVTHDRWFLDEVSDKTWEVVRGAVEEYEGGYSAYVLAKAERMRQSSIEQQRKNMLIRKELAWLRRGAPARTAKPKFRIDAANELINEEPPPRDNVELLAFAGARLGKTVLEAHGMTLTLGSRTLIDHVDWNVGPGDRIGIIGANGAGKTSLLKVMLSESAPTSGSIKTGQTVKPAYLSQHLDELDPTWRVLEAVQDVAQRVELGKGREMTASQLCERLGFGSDAQWTPVGDLSGGERRRLQLTRLLMGGPNVLVLDEPTNDFDVETLSELEDMLDSFGGTILVVSHDRYFLERVCDTFVGLIGDGKVRDLPRGIEQYLQLRAAAPSDQTANSLTRSTESGSNVPSAPARSAAEERAARKELAKLERQIAKADQEEKALHAEFADHAADYAKVADIQKRLDAILKVKDEAETAWMHLADY